MRLTLTLPLLAVLALPLAGCFDRHDHDRKKGHGHCGSHDDDNPAPSISTRLSTGEWTLADQANGVEIYRPAAEGGTRLVRKYTFAPNGDLRLTESGPDDLPRTTPGTWSLTGNDVALYPTGLAAHTVRIVSISAAELRLTR